MQKKNTFYQLKKKKSEQLNVEGSNLPKITESKRWRPGLKLQVESVHMQWSARNENSLWTTPAWCHQHSGSPNSPHLTAFGVIHGCWPALGSKLLISAILHGFPGHSPWNRDIAMSHDTREHDTITWKGNIIQPSPTCYYLTIVWLDY